MFGCKGITMIFLGEFSGTGIKGHLQGCHMRLDDYVRSDDRGGEARTLARLGLVSRKRGCLRIWTGTGGARLREPGILMATHVIPRPTVKAVFFNRGYIIGNKIVAQVVPLVDRAPELASDRVNRLTNAVSNARGIHLNEFSLGCVRENGSAMEFPGVGVGIVNIRT